MTAEGVKVVGKRSPRWSIWSRMTIPCKGGLRYLVRLMVFQCPLFGVYVHDIHEDDGDRDPHNHPYSFISIVLRGSYTEDIYADPRARRSECETRTHGRLTAHKMDRFKAHRIVYAEPGLKTLIFVGRRSPAGWGFFETDGTFVDWETYEQKIGTI